MNFSFYETTLLVGIAAITRSEEEKNVRFL